MLRKIYKNCILLSWLIVYVRALGDFYTEVNMKLLFNKIKRALFLIQPNVLEYWMCALVIRLIDFDWRFCVAHIGTYVYDFSFTFSYMHNTIQTFAYIGFSLFKIELLRCLICNVFVYFSKLVFIVHVLKTKI